MADGVRVASAYLELIADVDDAVDSVKKGLDSAQSAAKSAAKKMGDDLSSGIKSGLDEAGKSAAAAGKKIGDDLSNSAKAGLDRVSKRGKKSFDDLAQSASSAMERAGSSISQNLGKSFGGLNDSVSAISDSLGSLGESASGALKTVSDVMSMVDHETTAVTNTLIAIKNHDIAGTLSGISSALRGIGQSGAADTLQKVSSVASSAQSDFNTLKSGIEGASSGLMTIVGNEGRIAGALGSIGRAAGPIAAVLATAVPLLDAMIRQLQSLPDPTKGIPQIPDVYTPQGGIGAIPFPGSAPAGGFDWIPVPRRGQSWIQNPLIDPSTGLPIDSPTIDPTTGLPVAGSGAVIPPWLNLPGGSGLPPSIAPPSIMGAGRGGPSLWIPGGSNSLFGGGGGGSPVLPAGTGRSRGSIIDAALLSRVPPGRYDSSGDLARGLGDCSSAVEDLVNILDNRPTAGRGMSTGNAAEWLAAHGFLPTNVPMPGTFQVGWNGGHMQATLPGGTNFNWGSDAAAAAGGRSGSGAWDPSLTQHYYRPVRFDEGGWWKDGTMGVNTSGEPELVLSPDHLKDLENQGIDPASLINGGQPDSLGDDVSRFAGFMPAVSGGQGVAGTSSLARVFGMGNEIVGGLIDTGASLAQTAINAGMMAGTFGGSAAGGPASGAAASIGIQMGAAELKELSSYGFQLGAIWSDALVEQLFPLGAPRWIGYDYTSFLPQVDIAGIATTTAEKALMAQQADGKVADPMTAMPGGPVQPAMLPGMQPASAPQPKLGQTPPAAPPNPPAPPPPPTPPAPPAPTKGGLPAAPGVPLPMDFAPVGVEVPDLLGFGFGGTYDEGGWWPNDTWGLNTSGRPELVLTGAQAAALNTPESTTTQGEITYNITAKDDDEIIRKLRSMNRLQAKQYTGRPTGL